ncbi:MAG TPA: hypothetical protein VFZ73_09125 [Gemmatimonadaceae bacterium]
MLKIETRFHRDLVENSVAVTSVTQRGIVFGLNDSGHDPLLFAFDSTGTSRKVWTVLGASNRDWEAATLGPCDRTGETSCLYIGDVGDNDARRRLVTIYRVREPDVMAVSVTGRSEVAIERRLDVAYADHPHDVEALYVAPDGALLLISKRRLLDAQRRPRPALIYRVPVEAWDSPGTAIAPLVDSLPIVPGESPRRQITDAALSPDGRLLAVRTYAEVFVFRVDSITGLPIREPPPLPCRVSQLEENQGEGIGWWWDNRRLVLTSEGSREPLWIVTCPLPGP